MTTTTHLPNRHRNMQWKEPCRVATTGTITISTALNSGDTIDGVTLAAGDRVLVKDQGTGSQNGIYLAGVTPVRADDMDTADEVQGAITYVKAGTANGGKAYKNTNITAVTLNTTVLTFEEFGAGGGGGSFTGEPETPSGTIDGVNDDFTLSATPTDGIILFKNGLYQREGSGNDYTLAADVITYEAGNIPQIGDSHVAFMLSPAGGSALTVSDEGTPLATAATTLDFVGAGVTASGAGATKTITIAGGGGSSLLKTVRVASTANGTLATAFENGDTLDGVTLVTGDRILLRAQSTGSANGIYTVNASGAPTRASDFLTGADALGSIITVLEGTTLADTVWFLTTNAPITIGTTSLVFNRVLHAGRLAYATTATQVFSPDFTRSLSTRNTSLDLSSSHTAGDFSLSGVKIEVGADFHGLYFAEKDANTIQVHPVAPADVELADSSTGEFWYHRDGSNVTRNLGTMESRKGSGTATVTSGNTSVTVTHGAGYTPSASDLVVTPTNSPTNDPGHWWVSTIGATTFDINVRADPGASGATFAWRVDR